MSAWTADELDRIGAARELRIAARGDDGTLRGPTTIWVVRLGDELYVRSWRGPNGRWFRATQQTHEGHISAGGVEKDVTLAAADDEVGGAVDAAYRSKYASAGSQYVEPMVRPEARATTLQLSCPLPPDSSPAARVLGQEQARAAECSRAVCVPSGRSGTGALTPDREPVEGVEGSDCGQAQDG